MTMRILLIVTLFVGGCSGAGLFAPRGPDVAVDTAGEGDLRPKPRPSAASRALPSAPRTAEDFDTTSAEERAAAVVASAPAGGALGTTVVSLGDPTEQGFWLKTPLVTKERPGRVELNGTVVQVTLIPTGGASGGGSQMSLAAMRLLGVPLTALPQVSVFTAG